MCHFRSLPGGFSIYPLTHPIVFPASHDAPQSRLWLPGWTDPSADAAYDLIFCAGIASLHILSCKPSPPYRRAHLSHLHFPREVGLPFFYGPREADTTCTEDSAYGPVVARKGRFLLCSQVILSCHSFFLFFFFFLFVFVKVLGKQWTPFHSICHLPPSFHPDTVVHLPLLSLPNPHSSHYFPLFCSHALVISIGLSGSKSPFHSFPRTASW